MTQAAPPEATAADDPWTLEVAYQDFEIVETGDVDVFLFDMNERAGPPPFYIAVDGRRFALQRDTFLVLGHGAQMPAWIRAHETEGRLVLLAERDGRYLSYVHDPVAEAEAAAEAEAEE